MGSHITRIEVYPDFHDEGSMDLNLPFSYSCIGLDLMGYMDISELIKDIRNKLLGKEKSGGKNENTKK